MAGVHPRVCGEASVLPRQADADAGPSPRVRGSLQSGDQGQPGDGSIPACAGKPPAGVRSPPAPRVHPRVCGEARGGRSSGKSHTGPSPRVRGSLGYAVGRLVREGSIPACAGKPSTLITYRSTTGVHPRVCGEAADTADGAAGFRGPSPRVRGSHLGLPSAGIRVHDWGPSPRVRGSPARRGRASAWVTGSIPACAGKPTSGIGR